MGGLKEREVRAQRGLPLYLCPLPCTPTCACRQAWGLWSLPCTTPRRPAPGVGSMGWAPWAAPPSRAGWTSAPMPRCQAGGCPPTVLAGGSQLPRGNICSFMVDPSTPGLAEASSLFFTPSGLEQKCLISRSISQTAPEGGKGPIKPMNSPVGLSPFHLVNPQGPAREGPDHCPRNSGLGAKGPCPAH